MSSTIDSIPVPSVKVQVVDSGLLFGESGCSS